MPDATMSVEVFLGQNFVGAFSVGLVECICRDLRHDGDRGREIGRCIGEPG